MSFEFHELSEKQMGLLLWDGFAYWLHKALRDSEDT